MEKSAILDLLITFTETFVDIFLKGLAIYTSDAQPGNKYRKRGTTTPFVEALSSGGVKLAGTISGIAVPSTSTKVIGTKVSDMVGSGKKHKKKSKIIAKLVNIKKTPEDDLIRILIGAAFQVFWSFQYMFHGLDLENAGRDAQKMAVDAINRSFNYIAHKEQENSFELNEDSVAKAIMSGSSKGIFAKLPIVNSWPLSKIPTGGHKVSMDGKAIRTRELYEKSLKVVIGPSGENSKLFYNLNEAFNGYYRFSFNWEKQIIISNYLKEVPVAYPCRIPIITVSEMQQKFDKIFDQLKNRNIESKLTTMHKDVKDLGDMIGNLTDLKDVKLELTNETEATRGAVKGIHHNMLKPTKLFTGRDKLLSEGINVELGEHKDREVFYQVACISGLGGIGKTELARAFAFRYRDKFDDNLIWINAETYDTLCESFIGIARKCNLPSDATFIDTLIELVYKQFSSCRSLFVFDNANEYKEIFPFLPHSFSGKKPTILITSRFRAWKLYEEGEVGHIDLDVLTDCEAADFIRKGLHPVTDSDEDIKQLTLSFECLPLALANAVSYIHQQRKYFKSYKISEYLMESKKSSDIFEADVYSQSSRYEKTVLTTYNTTISRIKKHYKKGKNSIHILNTLAYLAPDRINIFYLFPKKKNEISLLENYSLITINEGVANIHRVLQYAIRVLLRNSSNHEKEMKTLENAFALIHSEEVIATESSLQLQQIHASYIWCYAAMHETLIQKYICYAYGRNCSSPLHLLAQDGHSESIENVVIFLNKRKILNNFLNKRDKFNRTPVYLAAEFGHLPIVCFLCEYKCSLIDQSSLYYHIRSNRLCTNFNTLHIAVSNNHERIVNQLIKKDRGLVHTTDSLGRSPVELAASLGHKVITQRLKPGDEKYKFFAEVVTAYNRRDMQGLKKCLHDLKETNILGGVINFKIHEYTALHFVAYAGWTELAKLLIENGATIRETDFTFDPIHCAATEGHLEMVKTLTNHCGYPKISLQVNDEGWTYLHAAAQKGHLDIVKFFLNEVIMDINIQDVYGTTPLHTAAFHGNLNVVKFLLSTECKQKTDIDLQNIHGANPLFSAVQINHIEIAIFLLQNGAKATNFSDKTKLVNTTNFSILHLAVVRNNINLVKQLIETYKMPVDVGQSKCVSALFVARFLKRKEIEEYLIEMGASENLFISFLGLKRCLDDLPKPYPLINDYQNCNIVTKSLIFLTAFILDYVVYYIDRSLTFNIPRFGKLCNKSNFFSEIGFQDNYLNLLFVNVFLKTFFNLDLKITKYYVNQMDHFAPRKIDIDINFYEIVYGAKGVAQKVTWSMTAYHVFVITALILLFLYFY